MRKSTGALSQGQPFFIFEGGYETYQENAQRLLATITIRSSVPLLAMREMSLATWLRRRMPVWTIDEDRAKALPLASQEYQPQGDNATTTLRFGEQLALKARIAQLPVLGELLALFAVIAVLGFLCGGSEFLQGIQRISSYPDIVVYPAIFFYIASISLRLITIFPLGATLIVARRRGALPRVIVDGFGISGKSLLGQLSTIPWQNITAWVVIRPPAGRHKLVRYIVYGDGQRLTWAEPENARLAGRGINSDRRQAYREQAARIHALIAVRTGLPLRELRLDAPTLLAPMK